MTHFPPLSFPPTNIRINLKRLMHGSPLPLWHAASSVTSQVIQFVFRSRTITIKGNYRNPIYDTVCEMTDYDSYQLSKLSFDETRSTRILDIGGNIGIASVCFAQFPNAQVVCLEPVPHLCQAIRDNLELNGITNVNVVQAAVTTRDGSVPFLIPESTDICGHIASEISVGQPGVIQVNGLSFQSALNLMPEGVIDLVKIDCEGGEFDIVDQMTEADAGRIRAMTFEVHERSDKKLKRITSKLTKLGYQIHYRPDMYGIYFLHHILAIRPGVQ